MASQNPQEVDEKTLSLLPVAVVLFDDKNLYFLNDKTRELFNVPKRKKIEDMSVTELLDESQSKIFRKKAQQLLKTNSQLSVNKHSFKTVKNKNVVIQAASMPVYFKGKKVIQSVLTEITNSVEAEENNTKLEREINEKQKLEKELLEKTAKMLSIFESSSHLIWTVNRRYQITSFNQNFHDVLHLQHGVNVKLGDKIDELLLKGKKEYSDFWYSKYAQVFKGEKLEFEKHDINYDKHVYRKIFINPIYDKHHNVSEISCIAHDITESKIYEQKLLNQTAKISAIFDSSNHYIWTAKRSGEFTSFNKNFFDFVESVFGVKPYAGLNSKDLLKQKEYKHLFNVKYKEAFNGKSTSFEAEISDGQQKKMFLEIFLNPIYENDRVVEISGIAHNITEKKQVQQRMEISLKEKEVLLREVHHRVKNNLQIISSILNLQSSYVTEENLRTLLRESQNRIKTMAYIHESLYQNKTFTSVKFSDYVNTLVNNIMQSHSYSSEKIKVEVNVQKVMLSLDNSIPTGLIVNELVTNAIKHAFPENRTGTININLKYEKDTVFLELKDNGAGFAEGVHFKDNHSLGLQLVNTLIEQLGGELHFKTQKDKGTRILITFKM